jgi:ubiquinone/menaquinone biosynthesis C-methylase UbiE
LDGGTDYYDFMAQMGVPYFHFGGLRATDRLMELCNVEEGDAILVVGCGTGYSACYIAEKYRCRVVGIDISDAMIDRAHERTEEMGLTDRVQFELGDAHDLRFDDGSFDAVITEFVAVFLDKPRAFSEFIRVLRPGGHVGLNELYKAEEIPREAAEVISEVEAGFREAVGLPFYLPTTKEWEGWFEGAGLDDVQLEVVDYDYSLGEYVDAVGGLVKTLGLMGRSVYQILFNREMKGTLMKVGRIKDVLVRNRETKPYTGDILCVGKKTGRVQAGTATSRA